MPPRVSTGRAHRPSLTVVDGLESRLLATIPPVMRHLIAHARRSPAWRRFTYQQYNVLRMIQADGPLVQADVARQLLVSAPVVTRLVNGLAKLGLVERRQDVADRRAVRLFLTAAGRQTVKVMRRALLDAASELLRTLPAERRTTIALALDELQVLLPGHDLGRKRASYPPGSRGTAPSIPPAADATATSRPSGSRRR